MASALVNKPELQARGHEANAIASVERAKKFRGGGGEVTVVLGVLLGRTPSCVVKGTNPKGSERCPWAQGSTEQTETGPEVCKTSTFVCPFTPASPTSKQNRQLNGKATEWDL